MVFFILDLSFGAAIGYFAAFDAFFFFFAGVYLISFSFIFLRVFLEAMMIWFDCWLFFFFGFIGGMSASF